MLPSLFMPAADSAPLGEPTGSAAAGQSLDLRTIAHRVPAELATVAVRELHAQSALLQDHHANGRQHDSPGVRAHRS
jgi:hypothetical protein